MASDFDKEAVLMGLAPDDVSLGIYYENPRKSFLEKNHVISINWDWPE
jgi:hypothetical protein